jgi:hypothetical protein
MVRHPIPHIARTLGGFSFLTALLLPVGVVHAAPPRFHQQVQGAAPILWYRLDEAAGNALNYGSLGASHDATYNGTIQRSQVTAAGDTGARIDGGDDVLVSLAATSPLTGNPTFSIEAVVLLETGGAAGLWGPFLHWGDGAPAPRTGEEVYFGISSNLNNRLYAGFYNAGLRTAATVPTGVFLHVVWVRQGGNDSSTGTTLYVNGVPVALQQDPALVPGFVAASGINVTSTAFRVNRAIDSLGQRFFTGTLDEIALYDRALSAIEVADHHTALVQPVPALASRYAAALLVVSLFAAGMWGARLRRA